MFNIVYTSKFKKDIKLAKKQKKDFSKFKLVLSLLVNDEPLPESFRDHNLCGNWNNYRECHINPDWLLIYKKDYSKKELNLVRINTHSEIFSI